MKTVEHCKVQNRKNILRKFISIFKKLKEKILVILKVTTTNFTITKALFGNVM